MVDDPTNPDDAVTGADGSSDSAAKPRRKAILVLGMHRSGTSALTRVISLLGADLPRNIMRPADDNPRGYWESNDLVAVHDGFLAACDSRWDDWESLNNIESQLEWENNFAESILDLLRGDFGESVMFAVKDPRICRFVPLWLDVLQTFDAEPLAVLPIRNPLEVAASLKTRNGFAFAKSYVLWLRYVLDAERDTRHLRRSFIRYESLLSAWPDEMQRLAADLGIVWLRRPQEVATDIGEFLSNDLRHHTATDEELQAHPEVVGWVRRTYAAIDDIIADGETEANHQQFDEIRAEFDHACLLFAGVFRGERADSMARLKMLEAQFAVLSNEIEFIRQDSFFARLRRTLTAWRQLRRNRQILASSGLFDSDWYLQRYDDVRQANKDPIVHYLRFGAAEGRDPSERFDTAAYVREHPEIAATRQNPLLHYLRQQTDREPQSGLRRGVQHESMLGRPIDEDRKAA